MKLIDPSGIAVDVPDEYGERLKKRGYKPLEAPKPAPKAPRKRTVKKEQ